MFSFRKVSPNTNTKPGANTKRAGLGEPESLRETYSAHPESIKAMRPLPISWVEYLEAQIPSYDTVMRGKEVDLHALTHLRGMKEAATILRNAFDIQQDRR